MDKVETIGKQIFLVAYWYAEYDDFEESILGVTNDYKEVLSYAGKMAKLINDQKAWHFDSDSIVVKKFTLNKCLVDAKLTYAHDWECGPKVRPFEQKYLWKLGENQKKLVNIESKSKWEECIDGIDLSGLRNLSR